MSAEHKVRDLMIPIEEYSTVPTNATVKEAIEVLTKSFSQLESGEYAGHRSVLVIDENQQPVGLLTFRDLIKAIEPKFAIDPSKVPGHSIPYTDLPDVAWDGYFTQRSQQEAKHPVSEVMRPLKLLTIDADAPLLKAVHMMVNNDVGSLPVTENGKVVGMIRINEVFMEIANVVSKT